MHNRELEEQLREQLEESKECIGNLLHFIEDMYDGGVISYTDCYSIFFKDAEKLLERLNEK